MNKKIILIMLTTSGLMLNADFLRFGIGYDNWKPEIDGLISSDIGEVSLENMSEKNFANVWVDLKHPIPVIPNIRLEKGDRDYSGMSNLSTELKWGGLTFPVNTDVKTEIEIDEVDVIPYYNLLDNTFWLTLNVGIAAKHIDAKIVVNDGVSKAEENINSWIPLGYVGARVNIPGTDIGIEGNMKHISYNDSKFTDTMVKIDYNVYKGITAEVGYKMKNFVLDGEDFDRTESAEFKEKGYFFGLAYRF